MRYAKPALLLALAAFALPAFAQTEKRLDYKQEQLLKDARYYLDRVEGTSTALAEKLATMKVGDASIQLATIKNYTASKDDAVSKLALAEKRFAQLPATHSKVAPELARVEPLRKSLAESEAKLNELLASLQKVVDAGAAPAYKTDFDRLREINSMFRDDLFQRDSETIINVIKQVPAAKAERQRLAEKYADFLKQDNLESRNLNGTLKYFDELFAAYDAAAKKFATDAPAAITTDVNNVQKMTADAVANKKTGFFGEGGGIAQQLGFAQSKYDVLAALQPDSPGTAAAKKQLETARAEVAKARETLLESIVQNNTPPKEPYNDSDKAQLIALIKTKWAEGGLKNEVLKVGINSTAWKRDTRWEYFASAWSKVDRSRLQGFVIIKSSDTLATIYYINLTKDHMAQDQITAYFFNDPKAPAEPYQKLLLKNVK